MNILLWYALGIAAIALIFVPVLPFKVPVALTQGIGALALLAAMVASLNIGQRPVWDVVLLAVLGGALAAGALAMVWRGIRVMHARRVFRQDQILQR